MDNHFIKIEPINEGEDDNGEFWIMPVPMLKGGEPKEMKVYKKPYRHIVNTSSPTPRGWYKDKTVPETQRPRPCYTEALLTTPYGGYCNVGCKFCYVDHGTRGYRATGLASVNPNYPEDLYRMMKNVNVSGAAYISSFTEPFQGLEDKYTITKRVSQYMNDMGLPIFYLSRKIIPEWAIDQLLYNPYSYMQYSINTSKTDLYKRLSPGSFSIEQVLKQIEYIHDQGIYVSIQCNPILPGIVTIDDLRELIRLLSEAGADHIIFKFVEQVYSHRKLLLERLGGIHGVDVLDKMLTQKIGGVYTIAENIRIEWLNELLRTTRNYEMTMSTCYEYYDNMAGGENLAPWFTTSDQCHGLGVPVHYRPEPGERFKPLAGCYRKGCLYCKEHGTHACNNETLMEARALEYKDLKNIIITNPNSCGWDMEDSCISPAKIADGLTSYNETYMTDAELWKWVEYE